jgi:hypothetical protein
MFTNDMVIWNFKVGNPRRWWVFANGGYMKPYNMAGLTAQKLA